jgi:hypothetical protein
MNDKKFFSIFLILALILISLTLALIWLSPTYVNRAKISDQSGLTQKEEKKEKVDLIKLEKYYEENFKKIFGEFEKSAGDEKLNIEEVKKIKEKALALKVPTKFKDLHINFILALAKMENYFNKGDDKEKIASLDAIKAIRENNLWLN